MRRPWLFALVVSVIAAQRVQSKGPDRVPMRIVVNVPAYRLDVYVGDSLVDTMRIAVGMPGFRTPRGEFAITSVEWNPWWIPPDRPWAAKEKLMPPGPDNPMGRVKLNFRPLYFLHGTPFESSIGSAASHGCIRLRQQDALALAGLVLRFGTSSLGEAGIGQLVADTATTRTVVLDAPIPIELRYDQVEVRSGRVTVYRDVYGLATRPRRDQVIAALAAYGVDTLQLDTARVRALVRRIGPGGNTAPIAALLPRREDSPDGRSGALLTESPSGGA